jgi:hypothetical protein
MMSGARAGLAQNMAPGLAEQFGQREGGVTRNPSITGRAPQQRSWQECASEAEIRCWITNRRFRRKADYPKFSNRIRSKRPFQPIIQPNIQPPQCGYGCIRADILSRPA